MLQGIGDLYITTSELGDGTAAVQEMIELNLLNFTYESEAEQVFSQKQVGGVLRNQSSAAGTITDTLTFRINDIDFGQMQFAFNQKKKVFTNASQPVLFFGQVPNSAPYEFTDTQITAANLPDIYVYINRDGAWGSPQSLARAGTPATPDFGEVGIDTTGTKFVFPEEYAGASFSYTIPLEFGTIQGLGGAGVGQRFGRFAFRGRVFSTKPSDGYLIEFPEVTIDGRPSLDFSNELVELEITATPATPSGWEEPFRILSPATEDLDL